MSSTTKDVSIVTGTVVGTIAAVQLLTDWDPVGRCLTFWRQLRNHVSNAVFYPAPACLKQLGCGVCVRVCVCVCVSPGDRGFSDRIGARRLSLECFFQGLPSFFFARNAVILPLNYLFIHHRFNILNNPSNLFSTSISLSLCLSACVSATCRKAALHVLNLSTRVPRRTLISILKTLRSVTRTTNRSSTPTTTLRPSSTSGVGARAFISITGSPSSHSGKVPAVTSTSLPLS